MTSITGNRMRFARLTLSRRRMMGFTLIELMISMVLGLLLIAGVGGVFLANKDAYRTNEAMSQVQDAARTSFEFLARDIREAGSNPCGSENVQSTLQGGAQCGGSNDLPDWVDEFTTPVFGTEDPTAIAGLPSGGDPGTPVADTDAIRIGKAEDLGIRLADPSDQPANPAGNFKLAAPTDLIGSDDVLLFCDAGKATIFQVSNYNNSNQTVVHNRGNGSGSIGNCTKGLNHPIINTASGNGTTVSATSYLAVPRSIYWYVGVNAAGGNSLYRARSRRNMSDPVNDSIEVQEMVRGVEDLEFTYHDPSGGSPDDYVDAAAGLNWAGDDGVDAVRMEITLRSRGTSASDADRGAGSDRERLERTFSTTVAIRNRLGG